MSRTVGLALGLTVPVDGRVLGIKMTPSLAPGEAMTAPPLLDGSVGVLVHLGVWTVFDCLKWGLISFCTQYKLGIVCSGSSSQ